MLVGGGSIASAIAGKLIEAGWNRARFHVIEPNATQAARISGAFNFPTTPNFSAAPSDFDVVIWAVKPQVLKDAVKASRKACKCGFHISVAAGISIASLKLMLGTAEVVRAMPNMAMSFRRGVTGLLAADGISDFNRQWAHEIFSAVGQVLWVKSDTDMDVVTAVSGSGPAYIFNALEAFERAAIDCGIPPDHARDFVLQVAEGAVLQARNSGTPFGDLRARVTSKNGTTEAALNVFGQSKLSETFVCAIAAARGRAAELAAETEIHNLKCASYEQTQSLQLQLHARDP
ncbi:pyrroline-5-carboxylate reductase [Burkholderia anthina]|uniref:pyrroline-5-carboxylate reductase n=1 Tax=Burkholderia anthina TaxID=179879 RepID=UPI0028F41B90|nr:pyrroline-5-carboxylate reductase [Burkholderia anthina]